MDGQIDMSKPITLKSDPEVDEILHANANFLTVITFIAPWSDNCNSMKDMTRELMSDPANKQVLFVELAAEEFPLTCSKHNVKSVPTVLFFRDRLCIERLVGQDPRSYASRVAYYVSVSPVIRGDPVRTVERLPGPSNLPIERVGEPSFEDRLRRLVNRASVMIFMKGTPDQPRCGFSRQIIELIRATGVPFETFDILEDEDVRQGLKTFSNWQTYPQVYVLGQLVGGLDIIRDLQEMGKLTDVLQGTEPI